MQVKTKSQVGKWPDIWKSGKEPPESMVDFFIFFLHPSASEKYENVWRERIEKPISNRLSKYKTLIIGISNMIKIKLM